MIMIKQVETGERESWSYELELEKGIVNFVYD